MNDRLAQFNARRNVDQERRREKERKKRGLHPLFREKCDAEDGCRACGRSRLYCRIERHHLVHRSRLMGMDWEVRDSPDNGIPLCQACHTKHHRNEDDFHRGMLSESEVAFIIEYAGQVYLDKHYPVRESGHGRGAGVRVRSGWTSQASLSSRQAAAASAGRDAGREGEGEEGDGGREPEHGCDPAADDTD